MKGDNDRAISDYTDTIRLEPNFVTAYYNRGVTYRAKGDSDRAIADYTEAIRLNPKYGLAYYARGNAYSDKGDSGRANTDTPRPTSWASNLMLLSLARSRAVATANYS